MLRNNCVCPLAKALDLPLPPPAISPSYTVPRPNILSVLCTAFRAVIWAVLSLRYVSFYFV